MDVSIEEYGPLAFLAGSWVGERGTDVAPAPDRGTETNKFREEMHFEPVGQVDNHEQMLFGLRYRTMAWEEGEADPFHEVLGYWLWDAENGKVLRCFIVPRGVTVNAGGTAEKDAQSFELSATVGSDIYGICSNEFLDREFKTVQYDLKVTQIDENTFSYEEDTQLKIKGKDELFHHKDKNILKRM